LILRAKNITARQFAEEIGIQPSGMSHILGGRNNPSLDFVNKVLRRYPEIDANWLIQGKGQMYSSPTALETAMPLSEQSESSQQIERIPLENNHKEEPSLFDEMLLETRVGANSDSESILNQESEEKPICQQDATEEEKPAHDSSNMPISDIFSDKRHLTRIIFIYSDNTFKELLPSK